MTQSIADGSTQRSLPGLNTSVRLFARASASLLAVRGAHWTDALMDSFLMKTASAIIKALEGNYVVMSLLSAEPFPRLSVHVGEDPCTRNLQRNNTARASRMEMTRTGLPDFSKIHGKSSSRISRLNHGEAFVSIVPSALKVGSQPPIPVLVSEA